jgi:hypothetical protein
MGRPGSAFQAQLKAQAARVSPSLTPNGGTPLPARPSDDCQIYALLGRELLKWDERPPDVSMFAIFYRPEGDGYVEQCPWAELGVTPLPPGRPDMDNMQFFTQPTHADDGLTASVAYVTKLVARGADGRARPPYINQVDLTLAKVDGHWVLKSRRQGPMT